VGVVTFGPIFGVVVVEVVVVVLEVVVVVVDVVVVEGVLVVIVVVVVVIKSPSGLQGPVCPRCRTDRMTPSSK